MDASPDGSHPGSGRPSTPRTNHPDMGPNYVHSPGWPPRSKFGGRPGMHVASVGGHPDSAIGTPQQNYPDGMASTGHFGPLSSYDGNSPSNLWHRPVRPIPTNARAWDVFQGTGDHPAQHRRKENMAAGADSAPPLVHLNPLQGLPGRSGPTSMATAAPRLQLPMATASTPLSVNSSSNLPIPRQNQVPRLMGLSNASLSQWREGAGDLDAFSAHQFGAASSEASQSEAPSSRRAQGGSGNHVFHPDHPDERDYIAFKKLCDLSPFSPAGQKLKRFGVCVQQLRCDDDSKDLFKRLTVSSGYRTLLARYSWLSQWVHRAESESERASGVAESIEDERLRGWVMQLMAEEKGVTDFRTAAKAHRKEAAEIGVAMTDWKEKVAKNKYGKRPPSDDVESDELSEPSSQTKSPAKKARVDVAGEALGEALVPKIMGALTAINADTKEALGSQLIFNQAMLAADEKHNSAIEKRHSTLADQWAHDQAKTTDQWNQVQEKSDGHELTRRQEWKESHDLRVQEVENQKSSNSRLDVIDGNLAGLKGSIDKMMEAFARNN